MNYKFNPFERAVGLFLSVAIVGSLFVAVGLAVSKKWFEEKTTYHTYSPTASNIRVGSSVLMAGLKIGQIEGLDLDHTNKIKVTFSVYQKYTANLVEGVSVHFQRPFIIGDKILTLSPGDTTRARLAAGALVPVAESTDLMDILSGNKLEALVAKVESILTNLDDTVVLGKEVAFQLSDKKKIQKTLENVAFASGEVRKALPHITKKAPHLAENLHSTVENLAAISAGLKELQPEGSKKTIELLNESVVVLQAMQKSFFLRGGVKDVKAEQIAKEKEEATKRAPASAD